MKKITIIELLIVIVVMIIIVKIWSYNKKSPQLSNTPLPLSLPYIFITKWGEEGTEKGQFKHPTDIAVDSKNNIYVADSGNSRIQKFDDNGKFITEWGSKGDIYELKTELNGYFYAIHGICVNDRDDIYVVDSGNNRIQKFDSNGNFITKWVGDKEYGMRDICQPESIVVDSEDNFYVDRFLEIMKFDSNGNFITKWMIGNQDGPYQGIHDMVINSSGYFYAIYYFAGDCDLWGQSIDEVSSHHTYIFKYDSSGKLLSRRGEYGKKVHVNEIHVYSASIKSAWGMGIDRNDNIFVAETGENRIQVYDPNGVFLMEWGSKGSGDGQFRGPVDVAIDSLNNVYVVDYENCRIQKFKPNPDFKKNN